MNNYIERFFTFDAESVGLHGPVFQVAGGVYNVDGTAVNEFCLGVDIMRVYLGETEERFSSDDIAWVRKNLNLSIANCDSVMEMRSKFWEHVKSSIEQKIPFIADCQWPVEARLLAKCINDDYQNRSKDCIYPLHDLSTLLLACKLDPVGVYPRKENELPAHDPLKDSRQSARLIGECLKKLGLAK